MFAIGRKTVDLRKKQKHPTHVKFPEDEDRLLFNFLSFVVLRKSKITAVDNLNWR